ncbi:MAG: glycosyltransferase family 39 protein [Geobacteraceae bacterium]
MFSISRFLTKKEENAWGDLAAILIVFSLFFFLFLGELPFKEPDESRYAEIPREMLESGDFITPRLNYVKYFEKPPLHYWVNALSLSAFGNKEAAARFPSALFGLCGVLLVYHIGRKLYGRRAGLYSALVLGSSVGYLFQSRMNIIDTTLTICMAAALGFFLLASRREEENKGRYYYLFYLFCALSVLAKGLIGIVLPGGVIFLYLLLTKRWNLLREMRIPSGTCLFLVVCAPWFILVSLKNPEFFQFFFIHEHFERFLTKVHGRYEPPWYFIPVLLGGIMPWSFFLPGAVKSVWEKRDSHQLFLCLWFGVIFVFFSLSSSKLIPYILPVFPAVALLIGSAISAALDDDGPLLKLQTVAAGLFLLIAGSGVILYSKLAAASKLDPNGAFLLGGIFVVGSVLSLLSMKRKSRVSAIGLLCLTASLGAMCAPPVIFSRSIEKRSTRELAHIAREQYPDMPLVSYGFYRQGLPFYAEKRVILAGPSGELEFGRQHDNQEGWFLEKDAFYEMWDSPKAYLAVISRSELDSFTTKVKTPVRKVAVWGGSVLVSNK